MIKFRLNLSHIVRFSSKGTHLAKKEPPFQATLNGCAVPPGRWALPAETQIRVSTTLTNHFLKIESIFFDLISGSLC